MSHERLDGHDKKILLIWVLAGLCAAGVAYKYFFRAFPEASVQFKVSRGEALGAASNFASSMGARLDGYQSTTIFDTDDAAKTYLEREVGLAQANRMMSDGVHVWFWTTRFFRPLQKEEYDVRISPAGGIVGYAHIQAETAPGARLEQPAAQAIAESFLRNTLHLDLSQYDFRPQEASFTERPNRRDWSFSWQQRDFHAKDALYLLHVTLAGDRVDGYDEEVKVPQEWTLSYQRLRSSNDLFEYLALIPFAFLIGACLYVIFGLGRQGLLHWRGPLILGLVLTGIYFLMTINNWPLDRAGYDTNTPYSSFVLSELGSAMLTSVLSALLVVLAVAPGEPLYRLFQPGKLQLATPFTNSAWRSKEFFCAAVIGVSLAAVHIGYITVFYIVSGKLGAWAPQDLSYTNVVSTSVPAVFPFGTGVYAATSEEFLFRLFAIAFLWRVTRSKFLAIVLPAFAWGFLHSNYPQEPAYIRGIEVGLMGIVAGMVLLRWGIWATLIWHYTVDAFLISTSLIRSTGAYLRISGSLVGGAGLVVIAIAGIAYLYSGCFVDDAPLLNMAFPLRPPGSGTPATAEIVVEPYANAPEAIAVAGAPAATVAPATPAARYAAMSWRARAVLIACGTIGIALVATVHREQIGDFVRFSVNAREATMRADQVLRDHQADPASYHSATTITYTFDNYTNEYLRRTIGIAAANAVYRDRVPTAFWTIRYFRDAQNEAYLVVLHPDGSFYSLHHMLDENTAGANLSDADARARAEAYLRSQKKLDLASWKLVETNAEKHPARTDRIFVWEQIAAITPESARQEGAHVRIQLQVQGDEVSGYRTFIKIPEAWREAESRESAAQIVQSYARIVLAAAALIAVLVISIRRLKDRAIAQVPWRRVGGWAAWVLLAAIVVFVNRAPQFWDMYPTTQPIETYLVTLSISVIFIVAFYFAAAFLLYGLAWFFVEGAFGPANVSAWGGMPGAYYRDAFFVGIFGATALMGVGRVPYLLAHWFPQWPLLRHSLEAAVPQGLDALLPASSSIAAAVSSSYFTAGIIALASALIAAYLPSKVLRFALGILVAVLLATNVAGTGSFLREAAYQLLIVAVIWFGVRRIVRFNLLGYFLLSAMLALAASANTLLGQPNDYFHANGYVVAAFALLLLLWPLISWLRVRRMQLQPPSLA